MYGQNSYISFSYSAYCPKDNQGRISVRADLSCEQQVIYPIQLPQSEFLILKNFSRQALHATHLGFFHPKIKKYIEFNANLPSDMENLIDLLLKY